MNARIIRILLAATFVVATSLAAPDAICAERVALVIGNGAYENARDLPNPPRDAAAIEALLKKAGFEVVTVRDAGIEAMYEGLERFKRIAGNARVGLLYFAGHGIEVDGRNYLLPVDAELASAAQLRTQTLALQTVLADMKAVRLPAKLVILDCCRDNPLTRSWMATRTSAAGGLRALPEENLPEATMIMYAAAPGKVALDGTGANSPFTAALVEHLGKPGISAFDAFLAVSDAVAGSTENRQVPWIKFDGAGRTFRLFSLAATGEPAPPAPAEPVTAATPPGPPSSPPGEPAPATGHPDSIGRIPGLPERGFFDNAEVYAGGPFGDYNDYSRREILKRVQTTLREEGLYTSGIDGMMGPGTQRALAAWQGKRGIGITGKLDTVTVGQFGIAGIREMEPPAPAEPVAGEPGNPGGLTLDGSWSGRIKVVKDPGTRTPFPEYDARVNVDLRQKTLTLDGKVPFASTVRASINSVNASGTSLTAAWKTLGASYSFTMQLNAGGKTASYRRQSTVFGNLEEEAAATLNRVD